MVGRLFRSGIGTSRPGMLRAAWFEQFLLVLRTKIDYQCNCTALRPSGKIETFRGVKVFSSRISPPESAK
jgi:hypothetical protein